MEFAQWLIANIPRFRLSVYPSLRSRAGDLDDDAQGAVHSLAVPRPFPPPRPNGTKKTGPLQMVPIDRAASFDFIAARSARPSRSEAAHHALPFFPKSSGKLAGGAIPIATSAAKAWT